MIFACDFETTVFEFTFHYGPIQITFECSTCILDTYLHSTMVLFKFFAVNLTALGLDLHSTMVLFKLLRLECNYHTRIYLHSTMVLFKSKRLTLACVIFLFTFHYGPIQINANAQKTPVLIQFTFHYGPIQILLTKI